MRPYRHTPLIALALASLGLLAQAVSGQPASGDKPILRVAPRDGSAETAGLMVTAMDSQGLASLDITCQAADIRFHSDLSGAQPMRRFSRTFTLADVIPNPGTLTSPVRFEITIQNTRGASASQSVVVHLKPDPRK